MIQTNRRGNLARRATNLELREWPKLILTMKFGEFCGPNKNSLSLCQGMHESEPEYRFRFTPEGISPLDQGDKRGATLPQKLTTPSQTTSLVCGLTAAQRPYAYEQRQSCPGVTQAVSYDSRFIHSTRSRSNLAGGIRALDSPFSTQIPKTSSTAHLRPAHGLPDTQSTSM